MTCLKLHKNVVSRELNAELCVSNNETRQIYMDMVITFYNIVSGKLPIYTK